MFPHAASRILLKWLTQMDITLKGLIIWPEWEDLQKVMPKCFQFSLGEKLAIIIDCFKTFLEWPSKLQARAATWSNNKHRNTAKVVLGIVPQGAVAFVSETRGGHVSDIYLTKHSGILNKLLPGDVMLANMRVWYCRISWNYASQLARTCIHKRKGPALSDGGWGNHGQLLM